MPQPKPKSQHRIPLSVTCSIAQKQQIDELLESVAPLPRSKYILNLLQEAMAKEYAEYSQESYTHKSTVEFQISCTPQQKQEILDYCDRYLPSKKRSRWIVNIILSNKP